MIINSSEVDSFDNGTATRIKIMQTIDPTTMLWKNFTWLFFNDLIYKTSSQPLPAVTDNEFVMRSW